MNVRHAKENEGLYLVETDGQLSPRCAGCTHLDDYLATKEKADTLFIPIGDGKHRRLSEATYADLTRSVEYLRKTADRQFLEAAQLKQFFERKRQRNARKR